MHAVDVVHLRQIDPDFLPVPEGYTDVAFAVDGHVVQEPDEQFNREFRVLELRLLQGADVPDKSDAPAFPENKIFLDLVSE